MAETNCAKWRRESVPVRLREKGFEALMLFLFFCTDLHFGGRISFVWCFWILAMPLGWSPLRLLACGEAVAFPIHLQNVDMMGKAVEQCASEPFRTEYGCPFPRS
jgi:hypothetical protein